MGISEETTKMRLHRARVFLRNALAGYVRRAELPEVRAHE
jgi:DNA-directed RNA polymerase specialized sigma24 family protein